MKRFDVVVGGANTDFFVKGPKLPAPGETVDGRTFLEAAGGKGANQAVGCARLGARVAFIGKVGRDDRGEETIRTLRKEGIDVKHVTRDSAAPTGVALVMVDEPGEKQILTAPGANQRLSVADIERAGSFIRAARVVLMQYEVPVATVLRAAQIARRAGARVVVDPAPARPTPPKLLRLINVVRPNASEAEALTGTKIEDDKTARRIAKKLFDLGLDAVALQIGESDIIIWPDGEQKLPRLKVKTVDATGAGDAFAAALAVAVAEGRPFQEAGILANAAAALTTTKLGAQPALPKRREVLRLIKAQRSQR